MTTCVDSIRTPRHTYNSARLRSSKYTRLDERKKKLKRLSNSHFLLLTLNINTNTNTHYSHIIKLIKFNSLHHTNWNGENETEKMIETEWSKESRAFDDNNKYTSHKNNYNTRRRLTSELLKKITATELDRGQRKVEAITHWKNITKYLSNVHFVWRTQCMKNYIREL